MSTEELRQLGGGVPIAGWFFYPLTVEPLADPNFDPGESIVRDAQTASVTSVSDRCFAVAAVHALNCHTDMLAALKIFLSEDARFQVAVGGNPLAVDKMLEGVRALVAKAEGG